MKRTIWLVTLAFTLLVVLLSGCVTTSTLVPATETPSRISFTSTVEPTRTPTPPAVDLAIKEIIGEQQYEELAKSIATGRKISGFDYATGENFEGTINTETIQTQPTVHWYFKNIVIAEVNGTDGNKFNVVWNPYTNTWVKVSSIDTDLLNKANYSHFEKIDTNVYSLDFDLMLLAQGDFGSPFPPDIPIARYWITVTSRAIPCPGTEARDVFLYLDSSRLDYTDEIMVEGQFNYLDVKRGAFTKGKEPFKPVAVLTSKTSNGTNLYIVINKIQNTDGSIIFEKLGLDPRLYDFLNSPQEIDAQGISSWQNILESNRVRMVAVFPTGNPSDWGNFGKAQWGDALNHGILVVRGIDYAGNVMIPMQIPGVLFNSLPDGMQQQLNEKLDFVRTAKPCVGWGPTIPFPDGAIPFDFASALSRRILEAGYTYGSLEPQP